MTRKTTMGVGLIVSLVCLNTIAMTPEMDFDVVIGGKGPDRGVSVQQTRDNGYIVIGFTSSFGSGEEDIYLVRVNSVGDMVWTRTYGGPNSEMGWSILEISDGYLLAGFTNSTGAGGFDFYLLKTDCDGQLLWSKTFGGTGDDRCWSVIETADCGYLLAGETTSFGAGEEDVYIVKTNAHGDSLWSSFYGGGRGDRCFSVAATGDKGFILSGQSYSYGEGDRDGYVTRTDESGNELWSRTFGGSESDVSHSIIRTSDDAFLITGYTTSFAKGGDDPYIIKIDAKGDTLWTHVIPMEGVNHTISADETPDRGFFLGGFTENHMKRYSAALCVKISSDGVMDCFEETYVSDHGPSIGYTIKSAGNNRYVLTGHTILGSAGSTDLFISKMTFDATSRPDSGAVE